MTEEFKQYKDKTEAQINEQQATINQFEEQLRQLTEQKDAAENQTRALQADMQSSGDQKNNEHARAIEQLTQENQQLIDRIIAATEAINLANEELQAMTGSIEGAQNKQEIETLLNEITQQLDQSIQNISRSIQGQPPIPPQMPAIDTNTQLQLQGRQITYGQLMAGLQRKTSQLQRQGVPDEQNKYAIALNGLRGLNNPNSANIELLLQSNNISIKENGVSGGKRKTKKNRKQKGGFTYKISSKRTGITSKSSRRSTRNSSRRSSR